MKTNLLNRSRIFATSALILGSAFTFSACTLPGSTSMTKETDANATMTPVIDDSMETPPQADSTMGQDVDQGPMETSVSESMGVLDPETGVRTFTIEAGSFYYKPNVIKVKKGEKVKVVLNSVDMMHDFIIDELNVKVPVAKSGTSSMVEFTPDQVGTFEYYCSVGQHRANGQVGTIIVE